MTQKQLIEWQKLKRRNTEGKLDSWEYSELIHLNHEVMLEAHKIHNDNMLRGL